MVFINGFDGLSKKIIGHAERSEASQYQARCIRQSYSEKVQGSSLRGSSKRLGTISVKIKARVGWVDTCP